MAAIPSTSVAATSDTRWTPWRVAPRSGFEVADDLGEVHLVQIDATHFEVHTPFRFTDETLQNELVTRLHGRGMDAAAAARAVDDARTFTPRTENPTDLASIPPFARWFENTYGPHTLAAILHDNLITRTPDGGALRDDTLADRFFRQMLRSVGVPYLKRWVIWTAVALRSRFFAGGWRQVLVCVWGISAVGGIALFAWAIRQIVRDAPPLQLGAWTIENGTLLQLAIALPFVAGLLWGRQYAASVFAAVAAVFVLPAVLFAVAGGAVYLALEKGFGAVDWVFKRTVGRRQLVQRRSDGTGAQPAV